MERLPLKEYIAECRRRRDAGWLLIGNTYPYTAEIKAAGGFPDINQVTGKFRGWLMPDQASYDAMLALTQKPRSFASREKVDPSLLIIHKNSYHLRETLKDAGGRPIYDQNRKFVGWQMPTRDLYEKFIELLQESSGKQGGS